MPFYPSVGDEQLQNLAPCDTPVATSTAASNSAYTLVTMPTLHADAHRFWLLMPPATVAYQILFITAGDAAPSSGTAGYPVAANTPIAFGGERGFRHDVRAYVKLASGSETLIALVSWPQTAPR